VTILDISYYQGAIPASVFQAARNAGITRVIHKAGGSNSGTYTDSQYAGNVNRIRQAGLELGHYWFNGAGNPTTDANYFIDHLSSYQAGDWLVIDVENENSPHWTPSQVLEFATQVFNRTGTKPVVYMSSSVTHENDWSSVVDFGCPLWVADYSPTAPTVAYWPSWVAWQYTSSGNVAGIPGHVDLSHEGNATATSTASVGSTKTITQALTHGEDMELIVVVADTAAAKKQNPKLYGSTAVITAHRGFVKTSSGLGTRKELDAWTAIAGALGIPITVKHVDANGFQLAERF
jgi:GH25 family lysozyme M1 (1,4-beta-N-acetylmuramidase)